MDRWQLRTWHDPRGSHTLAKKYMVHVIKRRFQPRSSPRDNPRTALGRDQKDDLRAGETRRAPSWVLQLLYSEVKSPQDNPLDPTVTLVQGTDSAGQLAH